MSTIATQIRDAMYSRLTTTAFNWGSTRKIPVPPVQIGQLPALGVYLIRETMGPDGDANTGPPRYIVDSIIGVMLMEESSTPFVLEGSMDALVDRIEDTLLEDLTFIALRDTNGNSLIDSIPTITRTYDFPRDGETQYIQCRLQFTIRYFVIFPPVIINDFNTLVVTVQPPNQASVAGIEPTNPANFLVEFETTPPQIAITTIGGSTNVATQLITGTAAQGSGAAALGLVYLFDSIAPLVPLGTAVVSGGAWSITVTLLGLGVHDLVASCSDAVGNTGQSEPVTFTLVIGNP